MKMSELHKIVIILSALLVLTLLSGCSTVFAPKDPVKDTKRNTASSTTPTKTTSGDDNSNLTDYEKSQKADAYRNLGNAYLQNGQHNMALAELRKALQLTPQDYSLMYDIGLVYLLRDMSEDAIPYFEDVIKLKPDYAPAYNSLGNAYLAMNEYDTAIAYYDSINDSMLYGTPYMPIASKGMAYFKKGDYVKAEEYYREALRLEPDYINALVLLGQLQTETGDTKEALKTLQRALRIEPVPVVQYYLGQAYAKDGDKVNAIRTFENILSIVPEDSRVYEQVATELRKLQAPPSMYVELEE